MNIFHKRKNITRFNCVSNIPGLVIVSNCLSDHTDYVPGITADISQT